MKLFNKIKKNVRRSQKAVSIYVALLSISMNLITPFLLSYNYVAYAQEIPSDTVSTADSSDQTPTEEPAEQVSTEQEPAPVQENPTPEDTIIDTPTTETPAETSIETPAVVDETPAVEEPQGEILDTGASDYRPEPLAEETSVASTDTDSVGSSDPVVQSLEEPTLEVIANAPKVEEDLTVVKECISEDKIFTDTNSSDWEIDSENDLAETKEKVKLGVKYIFPEEEKVIVAFSCLPKNEEDRATLKIQKIKLADLKLPEGITGSGEYAYDITTDMENGDFEYELILPKDEGSEVKVFYIEKSVEEATNVDLTLDEVKEVDSDKLEQKEDEVKVTGLDHFTPFFVQSDLVAVMVSLVSCGDTVKDGDEQCDGTDGVTSGENFCSRSCKLIPIYSGGNSCPAGTTENFVSTTYIDSTKTEGETLSLLKDHIYLFKVSDTFVPTCYGQGCNPDWFSDAGYTTGDGWGTLLSDYGISGSGNNYAAHALLGDLGNGVGVINWGTYENLHNYNFYTKITTSSPRFLIGDRYSDWFDTPWQDQGGMNDNHGSLKLEVYECDETPISLKAQKVVCDSEIYLPNWAGQGRTIDGNTATDYVSTVNATAEKEVCRVEDQWSFQWGPAEAGTFGAFQTDTSVYSAPWNTFTVNQTVNITDISSLGGRIEVRETIPDNSGNFIGFSNSSSNVSAEFYCTGDAAGYDNWEWVNNPQRGQTYYCVAFNSREVGRVVGTKYNDLNGNGTRDTVGNTQDTEPGLSGWTVQLKNTQGEVVSTAVTDDKGDYWFDYIAAGSYSVCEVPQAGWVNTDPVDGSYCKEVTVTGAQETSANFGNRQLVKISASKIICADEKDLPNWGNGHTNITSTTATDWVNTHESCELVPGWKFQWSFDGVGNPGDNILSESAAGWDTFGPTDSEGNTSVSLSDLGTSPTHKLWFREVLQEGYIPFTYGTNPDNSNHVSAEFYCHSDVLNYDNWEWIDNPQYGQTYYCVAFNSLGYQNLTVTKSTNPADDHTEFNINLQGGTVNGTRDGVISNDKDQVYRVLPGTYSVSEVTPAGWVLSDNDCESVTVVLGQDATCNLENSRLSSLKIVKDAVPNSPQDFRFSLSGNIPTENFRLDDDSNPTLKNNKTFTGLTAGSYGISEVFIADWGISLIECTGAEGFTPVYEQGRVEVNLGWGQDATCTFTNVKLGSVSGFKYHDRNGNNRWDTLLAGEGKLNGWRIFVDEDGNQKYDLGEKYDFTSGWLFAPLGMYFINELLPGRHKVCEEMKEGWVSSLPGNAVCKTVNIGIGENKQWVNFGNHREVKVLASKVVCDKESDLPNWGADTRTDREIDANTAQGWVDDHEGCEIVNNWEFEWAQKNTGNPGDTLVGPGGEGWTAFSPTVNGVAEVSIPYVEGDRLEFREVLQTGYVPFSFGANGNNRNEVSAEFYCSDDVANYDNWDFINDPEYGQTYYCVGFNALNYGTITVDKVTNPSGNETSFDFNLNQVDASETGITFSLSDDDQPYVNSQLVAGTYSLIEEEKAGWTLDSVDCTNNDVEVTDNKNMVINPGDRVECTFTNKTIPAGLHVSKWNDAEGNLRRVGNLIRYWIKVWTDEDGSVLNDVKVVDLLPKGFRYTNGSWRAFDHNNDPMSINEPHYASPGTWEIGSLEPGQSVTLEYTAEILSEVDSGLYKDLAWSKGIDLLAENVLALADETGYVNDNFVGTQVEVGVDNDPEEAKVDTKTKEKKEEVLGAATSILPATGISPFVIYLVSAMVVLGGVLVLIGVKPLFTKKKKNLLPLVMVIFSALMTVGSVHAQPSDNLIIRIEDPTSPVTGSFNLNFVVMDLVGGREITAECYKKSPSDADFVKFDTTTIIPGGDTKNCIVNDIILNDDGQYTFTVKATAESDMVTSDEVSVNFDSAGPGKPKWIERHKTGDCKNEITFKTADDGDETTYVEVYRSTEKDYTADSSNRIETINVGSNEEFAFTDEFFGSDCGKKYYYGVRAFDDSGNASSVRSEEITKTTTVEIANNTEQETEALLAFESDVASLEEGTEGAQVVLGDEASVLGEETSEAVTQEGTGTLDQASNKMVLWVGFALIALAVVNVVRKKLSGK